jgi:hypothetical protein
MSVVLSEVYSKSEGKIFQDKHGRAGMFFIGNAMMGAKYITLQLHYYPNNSPNYINSPLRGLSPRANYTDRAATACRRS